MPVSFNVNKFWQSFTGKTKSNPVNVVAQRFLQVFHDHGLQAAQIPRLLPQIKLDDLKSEEVLLAALTPAVLDQAAHLFGIRTAWLEGVDDDIYERLSCYKQPEVFFENLALLNRDENDFDDFYVQTLVTTKQLDKNDPSQQLLVVIVVEKIAELGDQRVYRYHVYGDGWDWGYYPTRIQLKAMARLLCQKFGKTMSIYTTKLADLENIREGKQIPRSYLGGCLLSEPSLEDFALSSDESRVAKEVDELPEVLRYLEEHNLESLITEKSADESVNEQPIVATVSSNAVKAANAKHARRNTIKEKFIHFYQTEGNNLPSKIAAAKQFFESLDEKQEKLQFDSKDAAIRTLLDALRAHQKKAK